jgi:hypothetical protein
MGGKSSNGFFFGDFLLARHSRLDNPLSFSDQKTTKEEERNVVITFITIMTRYVQNTTHRAHSNNKTNVL